MESAGIIFRYCSDDGPNTEEVKQKSLLIIWTRGNPGGGNKPEKEDDNEAEEGKETKGNKSNVTFAKNPFYIRA